MRQGLTIAAGLPKPNLRFILSLSGSTMAVFTWEKVESALSMCVSATDGDFGSVITKFRRQEQKTCKCLQAQNTLGLRVVCGTNHVIVSTAVLQEQGRK